MKRLLFTHKSDSTHWVGDGFPVRTIFTYQDFAAEVSPFLMMDYFGPTQFPPSKSSHRLGVGEHPHRGFETVTILYSGQVEHRDSAGGGGVIGPGDVQWMTAASGLVHEEYHGREFSETGGLFEGVQLWVNLPAKLKMTNPKYQSILNQEIPVVRLNGEESLIRVIAGEVNGKVGAARTFTPINLWDVRLSRGHETELLIPKGHSTSIFVLSGQVRLASGETLGSTELGVLSRDGEDFALRATEDAKILVLSGEPIEEPIVGYGPFVMNTSEEIHKAFDDFKSGKMGKIHPVE